MKYNTLYRLSINGAVKYFSTNSAEITSFASIFGIIGKVEEHGQVLYKIDGVVAQHPPGTFKSVGIKRQYFMSVFKVLIGAHAN